jgi:predicted metalloenzyme YecM
MDRYEEVKRELIRYARTFNEKNFNGRKVLICRLDSPLMHGEFVIEGIELLAPKPDNRHKEGLEHAEFVIKTTLEEFKEKHKEVNFDLEAYGREVNPELEIAFGNCSAKFHTQSLLEVRNL